MASYCANPAVPASMLAPIMQFFATSPGLIHNVRTLRPLTSLATLLMRVRPVPACSMVIKLHRILALALLCIGLLVAGAPAVALCAAGTPTHDCCPNRSQGAGSCSHEITPHSGIQSCCAAGAQTVAVSALNVTPSKTDIRPTRADPPLSIIFLAALGAGYPSPRSGVASSTPSFFPALSPLYLRTSRPRL